MLDIRVTAAPPRGFLRVPGGAPYARAEARYIANYALSPINPIRANGPCAFITALRDGAFVMRLMTFSDERLNAARAAADRMGFFALIDGGRDADAARELLGAAEKLQREWRNAALTGPVSPDGSGFFHGLASAGAAGDIYNTRNQPHIEHMLLRNGYREIGKQLAFRINVPLVNPLAALTARACARFGVRVRPMRISRFSEGDEAAIHALSCAENARGPALSDTQRQLARISGIIARRYSFIAEAGGAPAGFVLSLKGTGGHIRLNTLMTARDRFSAPATLALLSALTDSLNAHGRAEACASLIDADNIASLNCVKRFEGAPIGSFKLFNKNIKQI